MGVAKCLGMRTALAAAVMLAVVLLVLVVGLDPAGAAFPAENGKIAFTKFSPRTEASRIYTVNPDGSGQSSLGSGYSPSWSPDGQMVVFGRSTADGGDYYDGDIYVMDTRVGTDAKQITSGQAYDHSPSFSPDGETIAFIRETYEEATDTFTADIFTIKLDSTEPTNLTQTPNKYEESVAFSPEGSKIAFTRYGRYGSEIFVMDSEGSSSAPENLTNTRRVEEYNPEWSPSGRRIAFTTYRFEEPQRGEQFEENAEISVMRSDGTRRKDLTESPALEVYPAFSPDGTRISFSRITFSSRSESADIFVMRSDGSGVRRITDTPRAFEFGPDWQPLPEGGIR
jgi:TolB protein